jgi:DNA-binding MarR family transcriptional regulator
MPRLETLLRYSIQYLFGGHMATAANIFLKEKPTRALILLRDKSKRWYISLLAKEVDTTYPHMVKLVRVFEQLGLIRTVKDGRTRYIELTEQGDELAHDLEGIYKHLSKLNI